jgi:uncharacterized protein YjbJ (UPF0337 family)
MNKDIIQGKWNELKGKVKQQWGKLTDDDLAQLKGTQEELSGLLQQKYGHKKEEAEKIICDFFNKNCK